MGEVEPTGSSIEFNPVAYSLEAIRRACYEFSETHELVISSASATNLAVQALKGGIPETFRRSVLDHQVRIDTEERFRNIRELILAQAFAPCDNLVEILERCR